MAGNSTGFALSAAMAGIVLLIGYLLLSIVNLVGFATDSDSIFQEEPALECGVSSLPERVRLPDALSAVDAEVNAGDALFKSNCAQCHALHEKIVGPALAGVLQERPVKWLKSWIKNSSKMVASGDKYGVKVFNEYSKQQMPSFELSDKELDALLKYIELESDRMIVYDSAPMEVCQ